MVYLIFKFFRFSCCNYSSRMHTSSDIQRTTIIERETFSRDCNWKEMNNGCNWLIDKVIILGDCGNAHTHTHHHMCNNHVKLYAINNTYSIAIGRLTHGKLTAICESYNYRILIIWWKYFAKKRPQYKQLIAFKHNNEIKNR